MLFLMLVAQAVITPAQSDRADALAKAYFTKACADSTERLGVVTAADGILRDLSQSGTQYTVSFDEAAFRPLCAQGPLIAYHCHPTNDPLSWFPGLGMDGRSSDFGVAAYLEFMCAQEGYPAVIEHRIVHTGGAGDIIRFGLRGRTLERARGLGRQVAEAADPPAGDIRALTSAPAVIRALHEALNDVYTSIHESYGREVLGFLRKTCPAAKSEADLRACEAFSLAAFIGASDPCADRFIILPGSGLRPCSAATGDNITLGPRYSGWTELTPENYDAFTGVPHAAVAFCSDTGAPGARECGDLLAELDAQLPGCRSLARGYVDTDRHNALRDRDAAGFRQVIFLQGGERFDITARNPSRRLRELILCGTEALFGPG